MFEMRFKFVSIRWTMQTIPRAREASAVVRLYTTLVASGAFSASPSLKLVRLSLTIVRELAILPLAPDAYYATAIGRFQVHSNFAVHLGLEPLSRFTSK